MTAQAGDTFSHSTRDAGKASLRLRARAKRIAASRSFERFEQRAAKRFFSLRVLARARSIAVYLPRGSEFPTSQLIRALSRRHRELFAPVVTGPTSMEFRRLPKTRRSGLIGASRRHRASSRLDVVVLPLLAFDRQGIRLGQGGGYYDRLLTGRSPAKVARRVGYAWSGQEWPELPTDPWDIALHIAVTERGARFLRAVL